MPTLRELQEQRETLVAAARERLNQINDNTDESRTAELESQHDAAMAELDALDIRLAREERVAAEERRQEEARERRDREMRSRRPVEEVTGDEVQPAEATEYRQAFCAYIRSQGQIALLSDEHRSVLARGYQSIEERAQVTGTNTAGGYTVPTEMLAQIIRAMKAFGPMYDPGVTGELVTAGGNPILIPTIDDTAKTGAASTQGTTLLDDASGDAVFGQKSLGAFSFATPWIRVSKELADDSILAIETLLGSLIGERLGRLANSKLTVGAGTTEPTGIVVGSGAGVSCAGTTAFTFDEVIDLVHKVDPAYRENPSCAYMFSDPVLQSARKLKDGQGNYLWQHGNVQQGVPATLNGYRYYINQAMSQAFTTGQKLMIFGDLNKYIVRKVGAPLIGALQDKDFWPGFGVAGFIRFDGNVMDAGAIKTLALA